MDKKEKTKGKAQEETETLIRKVLATPKPKKLLPKEKFNRKEWREYTGNPDLKE